VGLDDGGGVIPKKAPEVVYEVRFSLQDREKEMAEQLLTAVTFNKIATPMVAVLKDKTAIAALLTLIAAIIGFIFLADENLSVAGLIDQFFTQHEQAKASGALVGVAGLSLGSAISFFLGLFPEES